MIRWGILGCREVAGEKCGRALQSADRSSVVACMHRDAPMAQDYAARQKIARVYSDADELISDDEVDAVYIATPPDTHPDLAIRALRAKKPVLVEKPVALTVADSDAVIAASRESSTSLIVACHRRTLPRFEKLREIVRGGDIGVPRCVEVQHFKRLIDSPNQDWESDPKVGGAGYFAEMQSHVLDWLDYVFGPATGVAGIVRQQSDENAALDLVSYTIEFQSVVASGLCAYSTNQTTEKVTIHGSTGSASMSFFSPSPIVLSQNGVRTILDLRDPTHVHQRLVARTLAHLLDGAPNPSPPETARRTTAIVEQLYS